MTEKIYPVVIVPLAEQDGGGYVAYAPDLHGCMSDGDTQQEAIENLKGAIHEWCDEAARLGRKIPDPGSLVKTKQQQLDALISVIHKQSEALKEQEHTLDLLKDQVATLSCVLEQVTAEQEAKPLCEFWSVSIQPSAQSQISDCKPH